MLVASTLAWHSEQKWFPRNCQLQNPSSVQRCSAVVSGIQHPTPSHTLSTLNRRFQGTTHASFPTLFSPLVPFTATKPSRQRCLTMCNWVKSDAGSRLTRSASEPRRCRQRRPWSMVHVISTHLRMSCITQYHSGYQPRFTITVLEAYAGGVAPEDQPLVSEANGPSGHWLPA